MIPLGGETAIGGGDLQVVFPESCDCLLERSIELVRVVDFCFEGPSMSAERDEFFLLTLGRCVECVKQTMPDPVDTVMREATDRRRAYQDSSSQIWGWRGRGTQK